jgi:adenylosuccinate synthase
VAGEAQSLKALRRSAAPDLAHQEGLTRLLASAEPLYEAPALTAPAAWIDRIEALSGCPVRYGAFGPAAEAVQAFRPLDF